MNLGRCIANLLRQYPEVGVPGIGIFRISHTSASFDQGLSAFIPPASHIELAEGQAGGFPITDYLQAQRQIDKETAANLLNKAVQDLFETISRNGHAMLEGLGYLVGEGKSVVFKPFKAGNIQFKPVKEQRLTAVEEVAVYVEEPEQVAADGVGKRHTVRWVIAAVLLVLLSAVGLTWYYQPAWFDREKLSQFFGQTAKEGAGQGDNEPSKQVIATDVAVADSNAVDSVFMPDAGIDSAALPVTSETTLESGKPSVTYEIIVGSFATMRQAEKYVAEMKAKGYDLAAINSRMPGNRKKISWGSFDTEEEAYRELARVQKTFEPSAWIAKVEHD